KLAVFGDDGPYLDPPTGGHGHHGRRPVGTDPVHKMVRLEPAGERNGPRDRCRPVDVDRRSRRVASDRPYPDSNRDSTEGTPPELLDGPAHDSTGENR